jgi:hypothetical protein
VSACRSCGKHIVWAKFEGSGKLVPLDPRPDPAGGVVMLASSDPSGAPLVRAATSTETDRSRRYRTHFETCPRADDFRRQR